jgi:flavin reductase (DIM6/NTAB) family NADH-FMN oxidoreductase RutF
MARSEAGSVSGAVGRDVDPEILRSVMRRWATGVTLVTAHDGRRPHGMTVSSFTSVSLDPALILVSLETTTETHRMVQESGAFGVSILAEGQEDLAERFSGRVADGDDRFAGVSYKTAATGAPIPEGALAFLDCRVVAAHPAGTHTLFIGQVEAAGFRQDGRPLLYYDRDYRRLATWRQGGK